MGFHVKWMIRREMPQVLAIETASFDHPWTEADFIRCLRQRNAIGMVVESERENVVGFMVYELHKNRLHLLNLAVDEKYRRQGVGTAMLAKLFNKLSHERRSRIMLEIRESNLGGQCFFRAKGFKAVSVLHDFWDDSPEDAYLMQYRHEPTPDEVAAANRRNRVSEGV